MNSPAKPPARDADSVVTVGSTSKVNDLEPVKNPHVLKGLDLGTDGANVIVEPGQCEVDGSVVSVGETVSLRIEPAPDVTIVDEPISLSAQPPVSFYQSTRLSMRSREDP